MKAGEVGLSGGLSEIIYTRIQKDFATNALQAICFDAGDCDDVAEFKPIDDLIRLPFPVCWVEINVDDDAGLPSGRLGALCFYVGMQLCFQVFGSKKKKWFFMYEIKTCGVDKLEFIRNSADYDKKVIASVCYLIMAFISALNCSNINRIEHTPSKKLQKARIKRGKQPLFSYWTLEIDIPKSMSLGADMGGTHASPRLHLRRGHPRQYAPGKWCWVQPHAVGCSRSGMIHKDYAAKHTSH